MDDNMKTIDEFDQTLKELVITGMRVAHGIAVSIESNKIQKTNVEKQGLTVKFTGSVIAPTFYTDDLYNMYQSGKMTIPEIANQLTSALYNAYKEGPELPTLTPDDAKDRITLVLVNTEMNQQLLEHTPHFEIAGGELSAIPRWYISDDASFVVTNEVANNIMLTPDEILKIGQANINSQNFEIKSMREVLSQLMGEDMMEGFPTPDGMDMIILSTENMMQGSKALLSEETLNNVHNMIGDYVVLPSSIHEVICIPISDDMDPQYLRDMVHEVNSSVVNPEDKLSDNILMYDGNKLSLVGDSFQLETPKLETPTLNSNSLKLSF